MKVGLPSLCGGEGAYSNRVEDAFTPFIFVMKKTRLTLSLFFILLSFFIVPSLAQEAKPVAWGHGYLSWRDNNYVALGWQFPDHVSIEYEQSIFNRAWNQQQGRIAVGYYDQWNKWYVSGRAYFGGGYSGDYSVLGARIFARYALDRYFLPYGCVNPHFDSYYGYRTCSMWGFESQVLSNVSLLAQYTCIPIDRIAYDYIQVGCRLRISGLTLTPVLSIPIGDTPGSVRLLAGFGYYF